MGDKRARVCGDQVISGVREIWVRNVYLSGRRLTIPPNATVVDLGANMGNFAILALSHGPSVPVVGVEGNPDSFPKFDRNLQASGWSDRAQLCKRFIGGETAVQSGLAEYLCVESGKLDFISEQEFAEKYNLQTIDFLKCDIEGSEFALLKPGSLLLSKSKQIAAEVHEFAGDVKAFIRMLETQGFDVYAEFQPGSGAIVQAKRRDPAAI